MKQVDRNRDFLSLSYIIPGFFHVGRPVYVIKNHDAVFTRVGQEGFVIIQGGLIAMVRVQKDKVNDRKLVQNHWQDMADIARMQFDVGNSQVVVQAGSVRGQIGTAFHSSYLTPGVGGREIRGCKSQRCSKFQNGFRFKKPGEPKKNLSFFLVSDTGNRDVGDSAGSILACSKIDNGNHCWIFKRFDA